MHPPKSNRVKGLSGVKKADLSRNAPSYLAIKILP